MDIVSYANKRLLVIVESPAKSKIIGKYLSKALPTSKVVVEASFGHVRDLVKKELGIEIDDGSFDCKYAIDISKAKIVEKLKSLVKASDVVLLASDNDREGEAIAWHLREVLKLRDAQYHRIVFNEITQSALEASIRRPLKIDMDLVHAQHTRRVIDRIVGFKLSPLLWGQFRVNAVGGGGLSAGRVQSAVLNILVEREKEIEMHKSQPFWTIKGNFNVQGHNIEDAKLVYVRKPIKSEDNEGGTGVVRFDTLAETRRYLTSLKSEFIVSDCNLHDSKESPDAPFVTSTLQQDAYNKLGFGVKYTMSLAQKLYEMGLITYMRTDSFALSSDAVASISGYVTKVYGREYLQVRDYAKNKKIRNSQEAHEAIRPTNVHKDPDTINDPNLRRLYTLIRTRTIASLMVPAIKAVLDVMIVATGVPSRYSDMIYKGTTSVVKFPGYLAAHNVTAQSTKDLEALCSKINGARLNCTAITAKNGWTSPPQHFNEPSLIKILERDGLGRPSTYSAILEKLYEKNYVVVQDVVGASKSTHDMHWTPNGGDIIDFKQEVPAFAEKSRLVPTEIGKAINRYLAESFSDLIDKTFTSTMEDRLDDIAEGTQNHLVVMQEFWRDLSPRIFEAESRRKASKDREVLATESVKYVVDGNEYSVRTGRYGPFIENLDAKKGDDGKYVSLKSYLALVKKNYQDITKDEVYMLTRLPYQVPGTNALLKYGRYGFYVERNEETFTVPFNFIKEIGGPQYLLSIDNSHVEKLSQMKSAYFEKRSVKAKKGVPEKASKSKQGEVNKKSAPKKGKPTSKPKKNKEKYKPKRLTREAAKAQND